MNADGSSRPKSIRNQPKREPYDIEWHPQGHGYYIRPRHVREFKEDISELMRSYRDRFDGPGWDE